MDEKKINLEEIINNLGNISKDENGDRVYYTWEIINMMKEACKQTLELAAEKAETDYDMFTSSRYVDKQSILNVINLIE